MEMDNGEAVKYKISSSIEPSVCSCVVSEFPNISAAYTENLGCHDLHCPGTGKY
jgi:hypothetical protein